MRVTSFCVAVLVGTLWSLPACARSADPSEGISIAVVVDHFELTVPVGRATMLLPKGNFEVRKMNIGGAGSSPRYFFFEDSTSGAIVAGWFESAERASDPGKTLRQSWPKEADSLTKAGMGPTHVENKTVGDWVAITYTVTSKDEVGSHVRASRIIADTWVDLHLSVTRPVSDPPTEADVLNLLQSLSFKTR
jgi:hypothetical protein